MGRFGDPGYRYLVRQVPPVDKVAEEKLNIQLISARNELPVTKPMLNLRKQKPAKEKKR